MFVPTAIGIGYLVGTLQRFRLAMYVAGSLVLALAAGLGASLVRHDNVITYTAARETLSSTTVVAQEPVVAFLQDALHRRPGAHGVVRKREHRLPDSI